MNDIAFTKVAKDQMEKLNQICQKNLKMLVLNLMQD